VVFNQDISNFLKSTIKSFDIQLRFFITHKKSFDIKSINILIDFFIKDFDGFQVTF